jgi:tetratricopeptide (TPR) repeat protein
MKKQFLIISLLISLSVFCQELEKLNYGEANGDIHFTDEEYNKAILEYDKAIRQNSNEPYNYYLRGVSNYKTSNYKKAITDLTKSLNLSKDKDYSENWLHGQRSKDVNGKIQNVVGGMSFEHYYYHVFFYRAFSKIELNDYYGAINDFKEYTKYDSENDMVYEYLGLSYMILEKYENSIKSLSKAIEINSNNGNAYFHRSRSYHSINEIEKCCLDLSKAGELGVSKAYEMIKKICS